jgi:hypothetical protein
MTAMRAVKITSQDGRTSLFSGYVTVPQTRKIETSQFIVAPGDVSAARILAGVLQSIRKPAYLQCDAFVSSVHGQESPHYHVSVSTPNAIVGYMADVKGLLPRQGDRTGGRWENGREVELAL